MVYQTPKCDCGHDLVWWSQPVYAERYRINKNGKKAKNPIKRATFYEGETVNERLECYECFKEYDFDFDEKGRIIRGDILL